MVPRMAVLRSLVLFGFLFTSLAFCSPFLITFTRQELLNIGLSAGQTFSPVFTELESFSQLLVRAAAALHGMQTGKLAGALVKRGIRTALPSIRLVNVHSLTNMMDALLLLSRTNTDFYRSAALCFSDWSCSYRSGWPHWHCDIVHQFLWDMCVPIKTFRTYNNNKSWFTANLRQVRQVKEEAYRSGDRILYSQTGNTLMQEIRVADRSYTEKLKNSVTHNNSASVWRKLKDITNYRRPTPHTVDCTVC